eukprot:4615087-Pyramimonas_sp.AAC.1
MWRRAFPSEAYLGLKKMRVARNHICKWPSANSATVSGLLAGSILDVRWDRVGELSGTCWRQFRCLLGA